MCVQLLGEIWSMVVRGNFIKAVDGAYKYGLGVQLSMLLREGAVEAQVLEEGGCCKQKVMRETLL